MFSKKYAVLAVIVLFCSCGNDKKNQKFEVVVDRFADVQIIRYQVSGFEELSLQQKKLIYYLAQAAIEGRDILFDQNCKYNLLIRSTLEAVYENYAGDKTSKDWTEFETYLKRIWFSNGIHHNWSEEKFQPGFSQPFFTQAVNSIDAEQLPLINGKTVEQLLAVINPVIFDPSVMSKKVNKAAGEDLITTSANNFYHDVTQAEVETFYANLRNPADERPVSHGLNSRLAKENGEIVEQVWKIGGMYSPAIEKIVYWLEKAATVAENEQQKAVINKLISFYNTGCLHEFDEYSVLWVKDLDSPVDFLNGFIETYGDPLGIKATWQGYVYYTNKEASRRTEIISNNAQWFEDNMPVDEQFKKSEVRGISVRVVTVANLGGDLYPPSPIGINLPNSNWIRREYGSKSVTLENIMGAHDSAAQGSGFSDEFYWSPTEVELVKNYGFLTDNLHVDLHELGHGAGKSLPGIDDDALRAYGAVIEEARADLFALYHIGNPKLVEFGLLPNEESYKAQYYKYMTNGIMTQLTRIEQGRQIEQAHMRNRALVARRIYEKGKAENVVEIRQRDGKTFVVVNDYEKLRELFGQLLSEVQRIKSEGDHDAAEQLVENYAIKVDPELHNEVLERFRGLNIAPYRGFVNPVYKLVLDAQGDIVDITLDYTEGYAQQMLRYGKEHSFFKKNDFAFLNF